MNEKKSMQNRGAQVFNRTGMHFRLVGVGASHENHPTDNKNAETDETARSKAMVLNLRKFIHVEQHAFVQ